MIDAKGLTRTFVNGEVETHALRGVDLHVEDGEFVAIMGRSGAGKSTLMYLLSLLDRPTKGTVHINGEVAEMGDEERVAFRLKQFGYVFQDYALLPELSAEENVALPLLMQGLTKQYSYDSAQRALTQVGLAERFGNLPNQLSGGEQQRVSIARSIAHCPEIIFADEPTANLDSESAITVMNILGDLHKKGQTIVMVTHEKLYAQFAERIVTIDDGQVIKDEKVENRKTAKK